MTDLPAIVIEWQAPAECPDTASVRATIERLLGKSLDSVGTSKLRATGTVATNQSGKWQLDVQLQVAEHVEEETLVANKCTSLRDAMALKVALAIDPMAVVESVQPQPSSQTEPSPVPRPEAAPDRFDLAFRFVGQVGLGPLPGATPGAGVFAAVRSRHFRVELGAHAFWAGVARYESPPEVGADFEAYFGSVRGCVTPGAGDWLFPVCAGPELGVMRARGFGVDEAASANRLWGGVVLGPALQWRMTRRLSLWVEADLLLTVLTPEFSMRNLAALYTPARAGARAALGFEANF